MSRKPEGMLMFIARAEKPVYAITGPLTAVPIPAAIPIQPSHLGYVSDQAIASP